MIPLTLRTRFALLMTGLLLLFGTGLVGFLNLAAHIAIPEAHVVQSDVVPPPGPSTGGPVEVAFTPGEIEEIRAPSGQRDLVLRRFRTYSLLGLATFVGIGGVASYALAGRVLRPIRRLTDAMEATNAGLLTMRLDLPKPNDDVRKLAANFNAMLERLQRSFQSQSDFVANAAHELRTPLTLMRTRLEIAMSKNGPLGAENNEGLRTVSDSLKKLERLVNDLLLLASEKKPIREQIPLGPLLEELCADLHELADARNIQLKRNGDEAVAVLADPLLIGRALSNLLENGIKYNRRGGTLTVTISEERDSAKVEVKDNGFGIAPHERERVFQRYYRAMSGRSQEEMAAGLGLYIVNHIVQAHGGAVDVESTKGKGSVFTVRLPLAQQAELNDTGISELART